MREYIVKFPDATETERKELERFERLYGTEEEIVRCKDCKLKCRDHHYTEGNWFCADGRRKEVDE